MDTDIFTGYQDDKGQKIFVGDILLSEWNYLVMVYQDKDNYSFVGSLICEIEHSCRNIPYSLNSGQGYIKVLDFASTLDSEV
jgi:hypothetical protein